MFKVIRISLPFVKDWIPVRVAVALLTIVAMAWAAGSTHAHDSSFKSATKELSTPADPVVIEYSAPVKLTKVIIEGPKSGKPRRRPITESYVRYEGNTAQVTVPVTEPGTYTLSWSVPQADGHLVAKSHTLTLEKGTAAESRDIRAGLNTGLSGLPGLPGIPSTSRQPAPQDPAKAAERSVQNELSRIARIAIAYLSINAR
jgi:methionine-rich copper-binding protein CopC